MATTKTADTAVREYLMFVADPAQLVDQRTVQKLERRVAAAADPIERLIAIAEHERAIHPDEAPYREAFIAHAKAWATARDVPVAAFEQMGVTSGVLAAAGMTPSRAPRGRTAQAKASKSSVTVDDVKQAARRLRGTFTSADVARVAGGSPMTIRKALGQLIDEGAVRRLGPAKDWSSQGRAPIVYERSND